MKLAVGIPIVFLALVGCANLSPKPKLEAAVLDCTLERGGWAGKPATDMPQSERANYLNAATRWALRHEYLPCNVTVCGAVVDAEPNRVSVFITGYGDSNPSAMVTFSRQGLTLLQERFFESGCPNGMFPPTRQKG